MDANEREFQGKDPIRGRERLRRALTISGGHPRHKMRSKGKPCTPPNWSQKTARTILPPRHRATETRKSPVFLSTLRASVPLWFVPGSFALLRPIHLWFCDWQNSPAHYDASHRHDHRGGYMKKRTNSSLTQMAMEALTEGVAEVVEDHRGVAHAGSPAQ